MQEPITIQSSQNAHYKILIRLFQKSRERKKTNSFVVEGGREIQRAIAQGFEAKQLWIRKSASVSQTFEGVCFELKKELFDKIAQRGGNETEIAVFKARHWPLDQLVLPAKAKLLVAEAPEKPGNIGAVLRTAAGAGIDAVFIANPKTDLYNPQSIRNSLGGIFSLPIIMDSSENIIAYLKEHSFFIAAAALSEKSIPHTECTYPPPMAIAVGTEADGLQAEWLKAADVCVQIPMQSPIDSLNVSVAAGILIYQALK